MKKSNSTKRSNNKSASPAPVRKSKEKTTNNTKSSSSKVRVQFLPDKDLAQSWVHRLLYYIFLIPLWQRFWAYSAEGWENVDKVKDKGVFFIGRHTTHNHDILLNLMSGYETNGHVSRSLIHRVLYNTSPWLKFMGCVPGQRDTAIELINSGFWTGVIPGGAEEALKGHENAYKLFWGKRQGFAYVAKQTKCLIVPYVNRNGEEMKFNPIFWLINKLKLHVPYDWIQQKNIPFVSWMAKQIVMWTWYMLALLSIPIPVKVTLVAGPPVDYDPENDSLDEIVQKSKAALQKLLDEQNPGGKSYLRGLKERFWGKPQVNNKKKKKAN